MVVPPREKVTTRQNYTYSIDRHIMPEFGDMRVIDIMPERVRAWITTLKAATVRSPTIRYNKIILSAIFIQHLMVKWSGGIQV